MGLADSTKPKVNYQVAPEEFPEPPGKLSKGRSQSARKYCSAVGAQLFIMVCFSVVVLRQIPPRAVSGSAPAVEFSSERAMRNLSAISAAPHPSGSPDHKRVRDYIESEITSLEIHPELQETTGSAQNIVARLRGTAPSKAILVVGHYDTVPASPGASDDGSAVAAMLETLRALKEGPPLKNDVILLFTDREETGLLGAKSFVYGNPLARDVGIVLNFDARGCSGQSIMFETSAESGWLITEFAKVAPHPSANSFMNEVYKRLPNNTDFSVFKQAGFAGLNFAFIDDFRRYHSPYDTLENIDPDSLQHQGANALALTRHFGDLNLEDANGSSRIYFDALGWTLISYPLTWATPLTILVLLLVLLVTALGLKRRSLTLRGLAKGFFAFLLMMAALMLVASFVQAVADGLSGNRPGVHTSNLHILGLLAFSISVASSFYPWMRRTVTMADMAFGSCFLWVVGMVVTTLFLPSASYIFLWPLLFSLFGSLLIFASVQQSSISIKHLILSSLCAIPGIVVLLPVVYIALLGFMFKLAGPVVMIAGLLGALLVPQFEVIADLDKRILPVSSALVGVVLIAAGR